LYQVPVLLLQIPQRASNVAAAIFFAVHTISPDSSDRS